MQHRRIKALWLFVVVLLPLGLFGKIADEVLEREPFSFDDPTLLYLHQHATPAFDAIMLWFSRLGYDWGVIPLTFGFLVLLLFWRRFGDALFWSVSLFGAAALNLLAKTAFGRTRPSLWESLAPERSYSFPSGHAMGSMAFSFALCVLFWPTRWRWLVVGGATFFVLGVGLSRLYLGVHYPSDVLGGWLASLAWVGGVSMILYGHLTKPTPDAKPKGVDGK